jgi:energy-coupling factor transporter ATP-binding protein EcfA2
MKIDSLRIRNFRCFTENANGEWGVVFRPNRNLNLIIGSNGSGKTAIVDAIDILMNVEGRADQALLSEYDFPYCDTSKTVCIEITLLDLGQAIGEFRSDIQWIDPEDGELIESKGVDLNDQVHLQALVIRFEAGLDPDDGEIKWRWLIPKFPETEMESTKELNRTQHAALGYFRIRPAVTAGAFTLGQYSPLGRHLRKLRYRLGKLPDNLRSESKLSECSLESLQCDECPNRSDCIPGPEDVELPLEDAPTVGITIGSIVSGAKDVLGSHGWNKMIASLGPRYGGQRSNLAALTLGLRTDTAEAAKFIPFEHLSSGEKYSLSFALAKAQVPGDRPPVILMEEPETALYPSAISTLLANLQSIPAGDAPQAIISSHSESVLRCFSPEDVFIMDENRLPMKLEATINNIKPANGPLFRVESLIMPGGPSALFADKILLVEGAQDAIISGRLDRLAARIAATKRQEEYSSFSSLGWCIFQSAKASNIPDSARVFHALGKKVAALFDGDDPGKRAAESTKNFCPTFIYKSVEGGNPKLEDALLLGLPQEDKDKILSGFFSNPACYNCDKHNKKCWEQSGEDCYLGNKEKRKSYLQSLCIECYLDQELFPTAFETLLKKIDSTEAGEIHELFIDVPATASNN